MGFQQRSFLDIDGSWAFDDVCFICSGLRYLSIRGEPMLAAVTGPLPARIYIDKVTIGGKRDLRVDLCTDVGG
jgi:hypothetical protein